MDLSTFSSKFNELTKLGFAVPLNQKVSSRGEAHAFFSKIEGMRQTLGYGIDGIVFTVDNCNAMRDMGIAPGGKQKPLGQVAAKFAASGSWVVIREINWSQDGGQYISPVGSFIPANIGGAMVSNVSLKSIEWMEKNQIGIGSKVLVVRSGDVIPTIPDQFPEWVKSTSTEYRIPTQCAHCSSLIEREGARLRCSNPECPSKVAYKMAHFLSSMGVKGLDVSTLRKYAVAGVSLRDFFHDNGRGVITTKLSSAFASGLSRKVWEKVADQLWA